MLSSLDAADIRVFIYNWIVAHGEPPLTRTSPTGCDAKRALARDNHYLVRRIRTIAPIPCGMKSNSPSKRTAEAQAKSEDKAAQTHDPYPQKDLALISQVNQFK